MDYLFGSNQNTKNLFRRADESLARILSQLAQHAPKHSTEPRPGFASILLAKKYLVVEGDVEHGNLRARVSPENNLAVGLVYRIDADGIFFYTPFGDAPQRIDTLAVTMELTEAFIARVRYHGQIGQGTQFWARSTVARSSREEVDQRRRLNGMLSAVAFLDEQSDYAEGLMLDIDEPSGTCHVVGTETGRLYGSSEPISGRDL
jgi:hypothetical protein